MLQTLGLIHMVLLLLVFISYLGHNAVNGQSNPDLLKMQFINTNRNVRDITDCKVNCTNVKERLVCATDGRTYKSRCEVNRLARCEGKKIQVRSKGKCSGSTVSKCLEERKQAQKTSLTKSKSRVYTPDCKKDGTYARVQCHKATGYCWCVADDGKPIPGSSVKGKKIKCRGKANRRRTGSKPKVKRVCNKSDRSTFNTNLIKAFSQEYARIPKPTPPKYPGAPKDLPIKAGSDALLDTHEKRVIEWKFSELDTDKNNELKKKEIREFKKLIRKLVKPKVCAKNFAKYCDLDRNGKIARNEWSVCLGVDINISFRLFLSLNSDEQTTAKTTSSGDKGVGTMPVFPTKNRPTLLRPVDKPDLSSTSKPKSKPKSSTRRSCDEERKAAQEQDRSDPEGRIFIPECVAGKYKKEQCHKSTGYCWCVNESTGKPIPGTSTHNVMPDCSKKMDRELKGCPYHKKKRFLTDLLDQMTTAMVEYATNTTTKSNMPVAKADQSLEEQAVRWKFNLLDSNKSNFLERRELRTFKKVIRKKKSVRKCGRNFIRYCDEDSNKKISVKEWIDCMGLNDQRNLPINPKRRGPNPFSKYLKS